jgi:hypothetical protein
LWRRNSTPELSIKRQPGWSKSTSAPWSEPAIWWAPTFADWKDAGKLIAQLARKEPSRRSKLQQLLNDVLIALCARRIGATVFTSNRDDFELIRRYRAFSLEVLAPHE